MTDKKIKMQEQELEYKKGFKWFMLPYTDIIQAYLRIEEVKGRMCCGTANFDLYFLMLRTGKEELIKIEVSSKELVQQMLEELKEKNPGIQIGYKKTFTAE